MYVIEGVELKKKNGLDNCLVENQSNILLLCRAKQSHCPKKCAIFKLAGKNMFFHTLQYNNMD